MAMNPEVKKLWIAALRSGKYQQAKGVLQGELLSGSDGYCCLGVLMACQGKQPKDVQGDMRSVRVPLSLSAGLEYDNMTYLAGLNDGTGGYKPQSFAQIADHIEATETI